ncbi:DegT/DnrJ/EryC1/StrS family aminotransferase [Bradyrhizobium sp. McL0615]|uniref:DegT/DnrJ/EryC1/StrS family aminotransferase n=1 Tax=Bradyrhizobium sp. McL0615 TaxID=3415673 RepID=UPI003CF375E9
MTIPQMEPWLGEEEAAAVNDYMRSGGWLMEHDKTRKFESIIADYTGATHCIVTVNGTVSLTLAALACDVKAGDEVIVPNYTMIATANAASLLGARPVFVDVEPETLCLDINQTEAALTTKTRAIMLVTANGRYPKAGIEAFVDLADRYGLALIEDAAQSLGSHYPDGRHIGSVGKVGSFSFSVPKVITTGQGGCLITHDGELAERLRKLKDFGRASGGSDIHQSIGYNFKFTDLQACVGIEQMKKLDWRIERKKEILLKYHQALHAVGSVKFFEQDLVNTTPWFIDILCERRSDLQEHLKQRGIGTRAMYPPVNKQEAYQRVGDHPVSELVGRQGLWLPSSSQLTDQQIKTVCDAIAEFYS